MNCLNDTALHWLAWDDGEDSMGDGMTKKNRWRTDRPKIPKLQSRELTIVRNEYAEAGNGSVAASAQAYGLIP